MTRTDLQRRFGMLVFGALMALGLLIPQVVGASNAVPNPALNPAVIPQLPFSVVCSPSGGQIAGISVEWEQDQQAKPVFRFEFYTQKKAAATAKYRPHGSNGAWTSAYQHFSDDTDHIFFTYALVSGTQYDVVFTTSQCGQVVDTEMGQYMAL